MQARQWVQFFESPRLKSGRKITIKLRDRSCSRRSHEGSPPCQAMKECRRNAARCVELAVTAHTPQLKATFLKLSKHWEKPAIQLEDPFAQIDEIEECMWEARRLSGRLTWKQ
jgi:hypothetical protein